MLRPPALQRKPAANHSAAMGLLGEECGNSSTTDGPDGRRPQLTVTAGQATDVVTVPLTSVRGSVKEGFVWLAPAGAVPDPSTGSPAEKPGGEPAGEPGGEPQERKVRLGLNDGSVVEIVSGLAEGEAVLEFIPGAPARQPGEQFAGPGSIAAGG
ncbi:hypothetical protein ACFVTM_06435 [Arthrobacter sp. NPDC058130]|uniref:hypothetical protein n=1 Tax=Arthrobacter sp. NPDC058130 TaxID=3346353 RepID=UPI0036E50151